MNEVLKSLLESVQLFQAMRDEYKTLGDNEEIDWNNIEGFNRIHQILYYESIDLQTELVTKLGLLDLIRVITLFKNQPKIKVFDPTFIMSIKHYEKEWEEALLKFQADAEVQHLAAQIALLPIELRKLIDTTRVNYANKALS